MSERDGYHVQNGCWNCEHSVRISHFEEGDELYCGYNAPPRPKSGSHAMPDEAFYDPETHNLIEMAEAEDAWEEWSEPRRVASAGICEEWQKKEEPTK